MEICSLICSTESGKGVGEAVQVGVGDGVSVKVGVMVGVRVKVAVGVGVSVGNSGILIETNKSGPKIVPSADWIRQMAE